MELTAQQFGACVDIADGLDSPLIWLWNLPHNLAGPLRALRSMIVFHAVGLDTEDVPTLAVYDRRDESLWAVGHVAGCRELVERLEPRELWVESRAWHDPRLAAVRSEAREVRTAWHMRREGAPRRVLPRGYGAVGRDELEVLRAFDVAQYGQPLDGVVDYDALLDEGLVHAVRAPEGALVATALIGRPGARALTVSSVWTHPRHRRRGHARRLMEGLVETARSEGRVCALNVESSNEAALRLYDGLGFARHTQLVCAVLDGR